MTERHNLQNKAVVDDLLLRIPGVVAKPMFGCPAYFIAGKAFVCVYEQSVVIKLPLAQAAEVLKRADAKPFAPGGGSPMGGWVQITHSEPIAYQDEMDLMNTSLEYVAEQAAAAPKKKGK